ncbi:hypothetical protein ASE14_19220 [Agromyces sp. Root81]|uniref:hypothetical protein n=1 Tax=Agromyces sp. Root81 TaxID=1736601 RepID=UPI0006F31C16|nr:hypothetical protein [Agromyces sp. Root81]KRC58673.1 hypothetical protein ASE14_19220 [Agromyces sp. Root81]
MTMLDEACPDLVIRSFGSPDTERIWHEQYRSSELRLDSSELRLERRALRDEIAAITPLKDA